MSLSIQDVADALGSDAQVGPKSIVVYREGKLTLVGKDDGYGFELTDAGKDLLSHTAIADDGSVVITAKKGKKSPTKAEVAPVEAEVVEAPVVEAPVVEFDPLAGLDLTE